MGKQKQMENNFEDYFWLLVPGVLEKDTLGIKPVVQLNWT